MGLSKKPMKSMLAAKSAAMGIKNEKNSHKPLHVPFELKSLYTIFVLRKPIKQF